MGEAWESQWASPKVVYTLGIHPRHIPEQVDVQRLQALAKMLVAVGECGLDGLSSARMDLQESLYQAAPVGGFTEQASRDPPEGC